MSRYEKTIVCLANSRKISGRCVAGKTFSNGRFGEWIRPVSSRATGEVSEEERQYEDGSDPKLLDVISIPMTRHAPHAYQQENHVIDPGFYWQRTGRVTWNQLQLALDHPAQGIWVNGYSSYSGTNDRIPAEIAQALQSSLLLIEPKELTIWVGQPGRDFGNPKRQIRANFQYGGAHYNVGVTDPVISREYFAKQDGNYPLRQAMLCISLGELFEGYSYKLLAAVITP